MKMSKMQLFTRVLWKSQMFIHVVQNWVQGRGRVIP